jgi:hypothetical protein
VLGSLVHAAPSFHSETGSTLQQYSGEWPPTIGQRRQTTKVASFFVEPQNGHVL